jgi:hypothetical protein
MKELSEWDIWRFVDGELPRDDLRRAIDLAMRDSKFRRRVRSALALRDMVRLAFVDCPTVSEREEGK